MIILLFVIFSLNYYCCTADVAHFNQIIRSLEPPKLFYLYGTSDGHHQHHHHEQYIPLQPPNHRPIIPPSPSTLPPPPPPPPPPPSTTTSRTTTEFFLPEIIINKSAGGDKKNLYHQVKKFKSSSSQGYPNSMYLPPPKYDNENDYTDNDDNDDDGDDVNNDAPTDTYLPPPLYNLENDILVNKYIPPVLTSSSSTSAAPPLQPKPIQSDIEDYEDDYNDSSPGYHYLPPLSSTIRPPQSSQAPYPPSINNVSRGRQLKNILSPPLRPLILKLNELKCLLSKQTGGYFKAHLISENIPKNYPVLDEIIVSDSGLVGSSVCNIQYSGNHMTINIPMDSFHNCGVKLCGNEENSNKKTIGAELCLKIRFPQISGMTTVDDFLLTLQCKVQQNIRSKIHSFHVGVSKESNEGRSVKETFAHGGSQLPYRTQIQLYRQSNGNPIRHDDIVQLGEDLVLKAHVKVGDGWNYTRLSDVKLQRSIISSSNGNEKSNNPIPTTNSATLIHANGCINPAMKSICPIPPIFEPPLGHRFNFRAIMFDGMKSGDKMIMSVKIIGCIDYNDCYVDKSICDLNIGDNVDGIISRNKRMANDHSAISQLTFRVEIPTAIKNSENQSMSTLINANTNLSTNNLQLMNIHDEHLNHEIETTIFNNINNNNKTITAGIADGGATTTATSHKNGIGILFNPFIVIVFAVGTISLILITMLIGLHVRSRKKIIY